MKQIIIFCLVAFALFTVSAFSNKSEDEKGLARVNKILGKEVYVLSEPLREYDVVETLNTHLTQSLVGKESISDQMQEVIKRGINRAEKGKIKPFDAVITDDGDRTVLVKFKD